MKPVVKGNKRNVGNNLCLQICTLMFGISVYLLWFNFVIGLKFFKPF